MTILQQCYDCKFSQSLVTQFTEKEERKNSLMLVIANLSFQPKENLQWKIADVVHGCCKGEGGSFGSVTLAFVSQIGPHWPLADFSGATYSAGKSQQVKQGPISWELALKMGRTSANREKRTGRLFRSAGDRQSHRGVQPTRTTTAIKWCVA